MFILAIVWIFWLFVAPFSDCDNERGDQRYCCTGTWSLYFSLMSDEFSLDLSGVLPSRFSLLHWKRKIWWRVWSPSFVFECWAFLLESSLSSSGRLCVSSWTLKLEYSAYTLACLKISMENLSERGPWVSMSSLLMQFLKCEILR